MAAVTHARPGNGVGAGFLDGQLHGHAATQHAHSRMAIDDCPGIAFCYYFGLAAGIHAAGAQRVQVVSQRPGAMGKRSPCVGHHQHLGNCRGVVRAQAGLLQSFDAESSQLLH